MVQDRSGELIGGLKNALERGENLEIAKKSFVNAGYKNEEVEKAAAKVNAAYSPAPQPQSAVQKPQPASPPTVKKLPRKQYQDPALKLHFQEEVKKSSKKLRIILIITASLILIGAGLIGLFWDRIVRLFG